MRIYLAGPMTGYPEYNFPAFDEASDRLRSAGATVVSPADLTREWWKATTGKDFDPASKCESIAAGGDTYREFLRNDVRAICDCDAIALLPGWRKSRGVALELTVALALGCVVLDATTGEPLMDETILQEAQRLVHGDRGADYGHPLDDYTRTGRMWGAILGIPDIDPHTCTLMMAAMKVSRECNKHKRDNLVDMSGYAECASMVVAEQARRRDSGA